MRVMVITADALFISLFKEAIAVGDELKSLEACHFLDAKPSNFVGTMLVIDAVKMQWNNLLQVLRHCINSACPVLLATDNPTLITSLSAMNLYFNNLFDTISWPSTREALQWKMAFYRRTLEQPTTGIQNALFNSVVEWAPYFVWTLDPSGAYEYINAYSKQFLGISMDTVAAFDWFQRVHPDDQEMMMRTMTNVLKNKQSLRILFRMRDGNGVYHWIDSMGTPRFDINKNFTGLVGAGFDVTDRVEAESYMRDREKVLKDFAESMPIIIFCTQPDGAVIFYNKLWYDFTGMPHIEGYDYATWIQYVHPDDVKPSWERWQKSLKTGTDYAMESRLREASTGLYRWHLSRASPLRNKEGVITAWYGSVTNIDDLKQASQEVENLCVQLENAGRLKDEFLATLSHELRTPLNIIGGNAELLLDFGPELPEWRQSIESITRNTKDLTRLVEDLLDVSKIITGKLSIRKTRVHLEEIVRSVVSGLRFSWEAKDLQVTINCAEDLPPILADQDRMRQVVWNLMTNAIKFTQDNGRISISVAPDGDAQKISVTDSGIGIKPEFLPHIFERFRQEDSSLARRYGGLGLGLSIVRHIVEMHGGTVSATSPGEHQGSTFTVRLPQTKPS